MSLAFTQVIVSYVHDLYDSARSFRNQFVLYFGFFLVSGWQICLRMQRPRKLGAVAGSRLLDACKCRWKEEVRCHEASRYTSLYIKFMSTVRVAPSGVLNFRRWLSTQDPIINAKLESMIHSFKITSVVTACPMSSLVLEISPLSFQQPFLRRSCLKVTAYRIRLLLCHSESLVAAMSSTRQLPASSLATAAILLTGLGKTFSMLIVIRMTRPESMSKASTTCRNLAKN